MKQEVRRGRKFVEYHDPATQAPNTFTQEISGADVSYQDEGGAWQQLVEDWETDGADGFSFRASRMNHKVRFDSIGAWRWYPRRNVETEYLVLNRPQCWLTATKRWGNLLVNGISREGKDITLTSLRNVTRVIHSRWNGIKTDWILLNANAPTRFRQKIDLVGITEIAGILYGADGERLGVLTPTTATDANGAELPCTGAYSGGYVEFSADVSGAAYPVTIDPDFASGTGDKAANTYSATSWLDAWDNTPGSENATGTNADIGCITGWYDTRYLLLFDTSSIGAGGSVTQVNLKMRFNYGNSPTIEIAKFNWDGLTKAQWWSGLLTADADDSVWHTGSMSAGTVYTSGNLSTAWINKTGTTYYGIRTDFQRTGTDPLANNYASIATANNATESYRPVLTVTYTTAAAGNPHYYYAQL